MESYLQKQTSNSHFKANFAITNINFQTMFLILYAFLPKGSILLFFNVIRQLFLVYVLPRALSGALIFPPYGTTKKLLCHKAKSREMFKQEHLEDTKWINLNQFNRSQRRTYIHTYMYQVYLQEEYIFVPKVFFNLFVLPTCEEEKKWFKIKSKTFSSFNKFASLLRVCMLVYTYICICSCEEDREIGETDRECFCFDFSFGGYVEEE